MKTIKNIFYLTLALLITAISNPASAENSMSITTGENAVSINAGTQLLLRYPYKNVPFKPYVDALYTPSGVNILRDAPHDHLHHHGLMFAVKVDGVNFWEEHEAPGRQAHIAIGDVGVHQWGPLNWATFTERVRWVNPKNRKGLLEEERKITIQASEMFDATVLIWQARLTLPERKQSAELTGARYHGLGARFLQSVDPYYHVCHFLMMG